MKKRVGTITLGLALIVFGVLGIIAAINPEFSISDVLKFWPIVLIGYGLEVLICSFNKKDDECLKYDGASIFFTVMLIIGAFVATMTQIAIDFVSKVQY